MKKTAVFVDPGSWHERPCALVDRDFDAYRLVGRPACGAHGLPEARCREYVTKQTDPVLRDLLIENQTQGHDVWIFHRPLMLQGIPEACSLFRAAAVSYVGVREVQQSAAVLAAFAPADLTVLPWDALRFTDFEKLEFNPDESYLKTFTDHADRQGFSPYLAPAACVASPYGAFADYLIESGRLAAEQRLFHKSKLLAAVKACALQTERPWSLLVDLSHLRDGYNGTMEYGRNLVKALVRQIKDSPFAEVRVLGIPRHLRFHGIPEKYYLDTNDPTVFDVCFRPYQIDDVDHFATILFRCRRLAIAQLDVIGSRCSYIYDSSMRLLQGSALRACDGAVFISAYGWEDVRNYFDLDEAALPKCVTYLAPEAYPAPDRSPGKSGAFLVLGNWRYDHKMLRPALEAVRGCAEQLGDSITFHFLADLSSERGLPARVQYHKHDLSPEALARLFADVDGFIFPSVYEGFGLPVAHALQHGKPILLADNQQNRDLQRLFGASRFAFFASTAALAQALHGFVTGPLEENVSAEPRTWDEVARETLTFLAAVAVQQPSDTATRQAAREALLLGHEYREAERRRGKTRALLPSKTSESPHRAVAPTPDETPLHPSAMASPSILPWPLSSAWKLSKEHLPRPIVSMLRAAARRTQRPS